MNQQGAHRYEDRLLEFAYGELPVAEARSIEAHVKGCARCTGALREIEGVRHQMSQLAPEPAPEAGLDSLLAYAEQAARRTQAGPAPARGFRRWIFGAVGAASLAAVLMVVGVVANRPELAPTSPESIKKDEARQQAQGLAQEGAGGAPAAAAATPAEQPPEAEQDAKDKNLDAVAGQADEGRNLEPRPTTESADPAAEPQVGKAVGKEWVQQVDVSPAADEKVGAKREAKYRERGTDSPDRMQNMVPGLGSVPALPTSRTPGYAQKTATAPADGEMVFPDEKDSKKASKKAAPKLPPTASKAPKKKPAALEGSGGGLGEDLSSTFRGGRGSGVATKDRPADDDGFSLGTGSAGSTYGGNNKGGSAGVARPSSPPAQMAQSLDTRNGALLDAQVQAKQRAEAESARRAQAEATRRDEEMQKAERAKLSRAEEENEAPLDLAKSVETRGPRSEPTPAPATTAPSAGAPAPGPSRDRGGDRLAMNAPPPPAPAEAPAPEPAAAKPQGMFESSVPSSSSSSRKSAEAAPPAKVRTQSAQELFMAATRARPGSSEEIEGLMRALPGLSGQYRIDALQRLCTRLEDQGDDRAFNYCSAWAKADPGSAVATKRAREAEIRLSSRKAKAAKPAAADSPAEPAKADTQKATSY